MPNIWKIAPGENAEDWPVCSEYHCIGLGWMEVGDYSRFTSQEDVLRAFKRVYKKGEPGAGRGAAFSVWSFAHKIKPGDIVVANRGRSEVVGIGVVENGYLPPESPKNPLRDLPDEEIWRKHVRLVDWRVKQAIKLPDKNFFAINTVSHVTVLSAKTFEIRLVSRLPADQ